MTRGSARRIGFFGLFGQGNLGNDASLEAVLAYVRAVHPDAALDARCSVPDVVTMRYGVPATSLYRYEPARGRRPGVSAGTLRIGGLLAGIVVDTVRTANWVRRHDAVIVPGMGVLEQTVFLRPWRTPYLMFVLGVAGKLFRTDVVLLGVGSNVIDDGAARVLVTTAARLARYRSFRDNVSKDAMRVMGLDVSRDRVSPDVVFGACLGSYRPAEDSTVGVGVMDYSGGHGDRARGDDLRAEYVAKMARFVAWLVADGRRVRVFTSDSADAPVVDAVVAAVREQHPGLTSAHLVAEPVTSVQELLRQTASVSVVVATRFHNVLVALRLGRPTIAIGYAAKHEDLMEQMGMAGYWQRADSLDVDRLVEQFEQLDREAPELRRVLAEHDARNAELARAELRELSSVLGSRSPTGRCRTSPDPWARTVDQEDVTMAKALPQDATEGYSTREFWSAENLKFSQPHFRMEKVAGLVRSAAGGREVDLLDVGCGPAALRDLLPPEIRYHGIDIAIHAQSPELVEADIANTPIRLGDKVFGVVVAEGVFEYLPGVQSRKFAEIADIMRPGGTFILTYWNFAHRNTKIYHAHSNVQRVEDLRRDLERYFVVDRCFPASHNWYHGAPSRRWNRAVNMRLNVNIPVVSRFLGVEYVFVCSPRTHHVGRVRRGR